MNADGSQPELLIELEKGIGGPPVWSPNGDQIAFVHGIDGNSEVTVYDFRRKESYIITKVVGKYYGISWSPGSKEILFMQSKDDKKRIIHINIFLEDSIFHADSSTHIDFPVWSPVDDLPSTKQK